MTLAITTLRSALRSAILTAGSNSTVIYAFPNGPRPELPYTTIQYLSESNPVDDWSEFDLDTDTNKNYGYRDVIYSINCYGSNSLQEASQIKGSILQSSIRETLRADVSAAIHDIGPLNNTTVLVDTSYEERATFDIRLFVNTEDGSTEESTGYFDTVEPVEWINQP
jgi:hypothetical protein